MDTVTSAAYVAAVHVFAASSVRGLLQLESIDPAVSAVMVSAGIDGVVEVTLLGSDAAPIAAFTL